MYNKMTCLFERLHKTLNCTWNWNTKLDWIIGKKEKLYEIQEIPRIFWQKLTFTQYLLITILHSETPVANITSTWFLNLVQRTRFLKKFLKSTLMQKSKKMNLWKICQRSGKKTKQELIVSGQDSGHSHSCIYPEGKKVSYSCPNPLTVPSQNTHVLISHRKVVL